MDTGFSFKNFLGQRRTRLAGTYLAIIVGMTVLFSVIIYYTSASHFDRFAPPPAVDSQGMQRIDVFQQRQVEVRDSLIIDLIWLNIAVLASGAVFSYYLAGLTLEPIEAAMRRQSQFISDASHELRTPLATLQTSNEVALRTAKKLPSDIKQLIESNIVQTEKLRSLTDGLLGLIKAENDVVRRQNCELGDIIDEVLILTKPAAEAKNIKLVYEPTKATIFSDKLSVLRVLRIFVENAIKYSAENTEIHIIAVKHGDQHVQIKVVDQGIGIAKDALDKIFTRFYREDKSRSTQHVEGYGLGLAIAKVLADQLDTTIRVTSTVGKGSTFSIVLPLAG